MSKNSAITGEGAELAERNQKLISDGGVEYEDYEIDPTELSVDITNRWADTQNNVTNKLSRIKGSDLWVCYRTWQTGTTEYQSAIKGLGKFRVEAIGLEHEFLVAQIREAAEEIADTDGFSDLADRLHAHAETLAEDVVTEWERGVEEQVGEAAYEGTLPTDGTLAWVSHVENAYHYETEYAITDVGIEETDIVYDATRSALSAAVDRHRNRWRNPHAEYIAQLKFDVEPWELRALELHQNGVFGRMRETARVHALRETGKQPTDIADMLGVNPSTVTRHLNRADEWLARANWTVTNLTESDTEATR